MEASLAARYLDPRYKVPTHSTGNDTFDELFRDLLADGSPLTKESLRDLQVGTVMRERRSQETLTEMTMPIAPVVIEDTAAMPVIVEIDAEGDDGTSAVRVLEGNIIRIGSRPRKVRRPRRQFNISIPRINFKRPNLRIKERVGEALYELVMWGYGQGYWDFKIVKEDSVY